MNVGGITWGSHGFVGKSGNLFAVWGVTLRLQLPGCYIHAKPLPGKASTDTPDILRLKRRYPFFS